MPLLCLLTAFPLLHLWCAPRLRVPYP
jgi:hypothetical protein